MRLAIAALALIALPLQAMAVTITMPTGGQRWLVEPPLQWQEDNSPIRIETYTLPQDHIIEKCSRAAGSFEDVGCAWPPSPEFDFCLIMITEGFSPTDYSAVLRHETAHCKGWPGDHPTD